MKKLFSILLVCLFAICLAGCNGNTTAQSTPSSTPDSTPVPSQPPPAESETPEPDYTKVYANYLGIVRNNSADISAYGWGVGDGQVAVADILGDATPELVFLSAGESNAYEAYLSVFRYENGESQRIYYYLTDISAGSGSYYCLFTTNDGKIYLYSRGPFEERVYSYMELAINDNGELVMASIFSHERTPTSADYTTYTHRYWQDGEELDESEYLALEASLLGRVTDIVVWSCNDEDSAILAKITEFGNSLAMSTEEAIAYLADRAGAETPESGSATPSAPPSDSFDEAQAIAFLTARIVDAWQSDELSEAQIIKLCSFDVEASDRLIDGETVFLIDYVVEGIVDGRVLVFSSGDIIGSASVEFADYQGYFETDILQ